MFDAGRRPIGRLFYWVLTVVELLASGLPAFSVRSGAESAERACDDHGCGHGLFGGWHDGFGNADYYVAGVCDGGRDRGGGRSDAGDAGCEWGAQRGVGAECGSDSGGDVLHGRVSAWTRRSEDGVLAGADDFSGEPGGGADDAGIGHGGAAGFDAIREYATGGGGAADWKPDGYGSQVLYCFAECADAGEHGRCGEQGICGYVGRECGSGKLFANCRRDDDGADYVAGESGGGIAGGDQAICGSGSGIGGEL